MIIELIARQLCYSENVSVATCPVQSNAHFYSAPAET